MRAPGVRTRRRPVRSIGGACVHGARRMPGARPGGRAGAVRRRAWTRASTGARSTSAARARWRPRRPRAPGTLTRRPRSRTWMPLCSAAGAPRARRPCAGVWRRVSGRRPRPRARRDLREVCEARQQFAGGARLPSLGGARGPEAVKAVADIQARGAPHSPDSALPPRPRRQARRRHTCVPNPNPTLYLQAAFGKLLGRLQRAGHPRVRLVRRLWHIPGGRARAGGPPGQCGAARVRRRRLAGRAPGAPGGAGPPVRLPARPSVRGARACAPSTRAHASRRPAQAFQTVSHSYGY